jgi:hypothetical protein
MFAMFSLLTLNIISMMKITTAIAHLEGQVMNALHSAIVDDFSPC